MIKASKIVNAWFHISRPRWRGRVPLLTIIATTHVIARCDTTYVVTINTDQLVE